MRSYKLLTPGPLTTTDTVKQQMLFDHCTWDDDYKQITQQIRKGLLELHSRLQTPCHLRSTKQFFEDTPPWGRTFEC